MGLSYQPKIDTYLKVSLDKRQTNVDDTQVACFLQLHSDVTKLEIEYPNMRFLQLLSQNSPNLEILNLFQLPNDSDYRLNYEGDEIHVPTVKHLSVKNELNEVEIFLEGLIFDNLHSMSLDIGHQVEDSWIGFLNNQNNELKSFELFIEGLTKEQLQWLPKESTALESVYIFDNTSSVIPPTQFEATDIATFIEENALLKRLKMNVKMTKTEEWDRLKGLLHDKWNVMVYNSVVDPLSKAIKISKKD